jgi:hypothetical protein
VQPRTADLIQDVGVGRQLRRERHRHRDLRQASWCDAEKRARGDADNRGRQAVDADGRAQNGWLAAIALLPCCIAQDGDCRGAGPIIAVVEQTSERRTNAQHLVHMSRCQQHERPIRLVAPQRVVLFERPAERVGEKWAPGADCGQDRERIRRRPQIDELFRTLHRQRFEEQRVGQRIGERRRADAEDQRRDRGHAEHRPSDEQPEGVPYILSERIDPRWNPHLTRALTHQQVVAHGPVDLEPALAGVAEGAGRSTELLGLHGAMDGHLLGEIAREAAVSNAGAQAVPEDAHLRPAAARG